MSTDEPLGQPGDGSPGVRAATQDVRAEVSTTTAAPEFRVRVEHVAKTYVTRSLWPLVRRNRVLTDASLEIAPGEITAIVGANGSGKSTLMMIIAGVLERDAGRVAVNGRLGYCPQTPVLYEKLTVAETFRLFGVAYGMDDGSVVRQQKYLLDALEFGEYHDYRIEHLSGGTQQKLNLALALLLSPPLGPAPVPGVEVTKPSWVFIWLYPFENWWGLTALLWIPIGLVLALALIPFLDRARTNALRNRWLLLLIVVIVFAVIVALGVYGRLTVPQAHLIE